MSRYSSRSGILYVMPLTLYPIGNKIKETANQPPIQRALASSVTYLRVALGTQEEESARRTRLTLERYRKTCRKEYLEAVGFEESSFFTLESMMTER